MIYSLYWEIPSANNNPSCLSQKWWAVKTKLFLSPNQLGHQIKNKTIRYWTETNFRTNMKMSLGLFTHCNPVIQIENNQVTYFCLSPSVEVVGVAVLVYWTWGYWWDWSGPIHYEDAPYMTKRSGQWSETQIRTTLMMDAGPGHVAPTSQCEKSKGTVKEMERYKFDSRS